MADSISDAATASLDPSVAEAAFSVHAMDESSHPTLQRDYSTIGIGPVFASPLPDHPLPQSYLDNSDQIWPFLSTELVATIKSCPQDFVVREIAPSGRKVFGLADDQVESIRIADLHALCPDLWKDDLFPAGTATDATGKNAPAPTTPTDAATAMDEAATPLSMQELLDKELRLTEEGSDMSLASIQSLNSQAEAILAGTPIDTLNSEVWLTPLTSTSDGQSLDRASFHHSFRLLFPLLTAESVLRQPQTSSDAIKTYNIRIIIDDRFHEIISLLDDPLSDLKAIYAFFKRKVDRSNLNATSTLVLKKGLPRDSRRIIHQTINAKTNRSLGTSTVTDYTMADGSLSVAISVQWSKQSCRRAANKREGIQNSAFLQFPHTLCVLKKTQKEHLVALQTLQRALKVSLPDIGLAGIKDMHAVTYQFATIANVSPQRLVRQAAVLQSQGIEIGTIYKVDWKLNKGDLEGNRFEIILRNVRRVQIKCNGKDMVEESLVTADMSHVEAMIDRVRSHGFVNFYGTQRVGEPGLPSVVGVRGFDIGRAMLQQDYTKAIDLLMAGRLVCHGAEAESDDIRAVREVWQKSNGDVNLTYKKLPRSSKMARERAVLQGLKRHGKDNALEAIRCLGFNERTFWVSAYQSYVFNVMTTKRLKTFGCRVVPGDLVMRTSDGIVAVAADADCEQYTIYDVVLPLPGHGVQLPSNSIGKMYQQFLQQEQVRFLKDDVPPESTAKGSYRHIIKRVATIHSSRLDADDDGLDVRICFDLTAGSYATMFLRELMLTTVKRVFSY